MENWRRYLNEQEGVKSKPKCAVLFDGGGYARVGLEAAGWDCTGYELNPIAHWFGGHHGKAGSKSQLADATSVDLSPFDAVWASPPCQTRSNANPSGISSGQYSKDFVDFSLDLWDKYENLKILWVENVATTKKDQRRFGTPSNASQYSENPTQNRIREMGGKYPKPETYSEFSRRYINFPNICPTIVATEFKAGKTATRRGGTRWAFNSFDEDGEKTEFGKERDKVREAAGMKPLKHGESVKLVDYPKEIHNLMVGDVGFIKEGEFEIPEEWMEVYEDLIQRGRKRWGEGEYREFLRKHKLENVYKSFSNSSITATKWRNEMVRVMGNGVVIKKAYEFGRAGIKELERIEEMEGDPRDFIEYSEHDLGNEEENVAGNEGSDVINHEEYEEYEKYKDFAI